MVFLMSYAIEKMAKFSKKGWWERYKRGTMGMWSRDRFERAPIHLNHLSLSRHTHYLLCAKLFISLNRCCEGLFEKWDALFCRVTEPVERAKDSENFEGGCCEETLSISFLRTINENGLEICRKIWYKMQNCRWRDLRINFHLCPVFFRFSPLCVRVEWGN